MFGLIGVVSIPVGRDLILYVVIVGVMIILNYTPTTHHVFGGKVELVDETF
jgi:hypothetical protein